MSDLSCLSPLDGRYRRKTEYLREFFSEYALIRHRLEIEIEYLIELCEKTSICYLPDGLKPEDLREIYQEEKFTLAEADRVKVLESTTNHDVKAVEYYLKMILSDHPDLARWIHFALTSQDINTSANMLQMKRSWEYVIQPNLHQVISCIQTLGKMYLKFPMVARTHGQSASPTTLGKEMMVFVERMVNQLKIEEHTPWTTKFGGATGNFNAHVLTFPETNWTDFANHFIQRLGLSRSQYTTQIDHYDHLAAHFDNYKRISTILIDFCRDIWQYISMDYFKLRIVSDEVGSSAMPHKVNPIDFENAEGNLMLANTLFEFLSRKLPISRLQRDLTDSTVLRNVGTACGYLMVALQSLTKGIQKLEANQEKLSEDLNRHWIVIAEGIQNILKREGIMNGFELVKGLTRCHNTPTTDEMIEFVRKLDISEQVKDEILNLRPDIYLGYADQDIFSDI